MLRLYRARSVSWLRLDETTEDTEDHRGTNCGLASSRKISASSLSEPNGKNSVFLCGFTGLSGNTCLPAALRARGFVCGDLRFVLQGESNFVEPFEQAGATEVVDRKGCGKTLVITNSLVD